MIHTSKVTSGYAIKLPAIVDRTFTFTPGLNVLFGPNGIGKSSVLRITAAHVGCGEYGWSSPAGSFGKVPYPQRFHDESPGQCDAIVEWDGVAAFLQKTEVARGSMLPDNAEDFQEVIQDLFAKPSSGQGVIGQLMSLRNTLKNVPDLTDLKGKWRIHGESIAFDRVNSVWQEYITSFVDYVKARPAPAEKRITVFIDEPDRSLSIPNQADLWRVVLPNLATKAQVIVATHSVFALGADANVIEFTDGYVAKCREAIASLSKPT